MGSRSNIIMQTWVRALAATAAVVTLAPCAAAQAAFPTLTTLHQFPFPSMGDGLFPNAPLAIGTDGTVYGTTEWGGTVNSSCTQGCGTVFSLTPPGASGANWSEAVLYSFAGGADGSNPYFAGVLVGDGGVLYGTTAGGGGVPNDGTVFSLTPPGSSGGSWAETLLYSFKGQANGDGAGPAGMLISDKSGVLYGVTQAGGAYGLGTAFSLTPPAVSEATWTETILWSFGAGGDGAYSIAGLVMGAHGVLYGTTVAGGAANLGTVFSLTPPSVAGGPWTETVLHSFAGPDGETPGYGTLVASPGGVLFGTTEYGGAESGGGGTVFSLTPPAAPGGSWTETVLYGFRFNSGDVPFDGVVRNSTTGALYGATSGGGATSRSMGTVFQLTPPASRGGPWTYTDLHSFLPGKGFSNPDGIAPWAGVAIGPGHTLYGTTSGRYLSITINGGTVFSLQW